MHRAYPFATLLLLVVVPTLASCSGSSQPAAARTAQSATVGTATSNGVTCAQANGTIQLLVNAQNTFTASQQSVQDDLQYMVVVDEGVSIAKVRGWAKGTSQLSQDFSQFVSDAAQYTNGSVDTPQSVESDISTLAADCSIAQG